MALRHRTERRHGCSLHLQFCAVTTHNRFTGATYGTPRQLCLGPAIHLYKICTSRNAHSQARISALSATVRPTNTATPMGRMHWATAHRWPLLVHCWNSIPIGTGGKGGREDLRCGVKPFLVEIRQIRQTRSLATVTSKPTPNARQPLSVLPQALVSHRSTAVGYAPMVKESPSELAQPVVLVLPWAHAVLSTARSTSRRAAGWWMGKGGVQ